MTWPERKCSSDVATAGFTVRRGERAGGCGRKGGKIRCRFAGPAPVAWERPRYLLRDVSDAAAEGREIGGGCGRRGRRFRRGSSAVDPLLAPVNSLRFSSSTPHGSASNSFSNLCIRSVLTFFRHYPSQLWKELLRTSHCELLLYRPRSTIPSMSSSSETLHLKDY